MKTISELNADVLELEITVLMEVLRSGELSVKDRLRALQQLQTAVEKIS